jgi:hypothetical protein
VPRPAAEGRPTPAARLQKHCSHPTQADIIGERTDMFPNLDTVIGRLALACSVADEDLWDVCCVDRSSLVSGRLLR